jgi:hypothetical protein
MLRRLLVPLFTGLTVMAAAAPARKPPAAAPKPLSRAPVKPPMRAPAPAKPPLPVAPPPTAAEPGIRAPVNVNLLAASRRVALTHSPPAGGSAAAFDGNRHTAVRVTAPGGAFWQVTLDRPRPVEACDVVFPEGESHHWALFGALTEADMTARAGSFTALSPTRPARQGDRDQALFEKPRPLRVFRLECRPVVAGGNAALAEWALWTPQQVTALTVDTFVPTVIPGERIQLRALASLDAGGEANLTPEVRWEVNPPTAGRVDDLQRFEAAAVGPARLTALYAGRRSAPLTVEVLAAGQPDWTVTYIERQPRRDFESGESEPRPGQLVYWFAHVKNYGTANAEPVPFEWRVNGEILAHGKLPKVERFQQTDVVISSRWEPGSQRLELAVDPANEVPEISETNNRLQVPSDGLPVGFWLEDSVMRHFHRHQRELGIGSNSWEDWAQRQIGAWNRWMEGGRWLWSTPEIAARRYRLDRVVVVGDGMLPMSPGNAQTAPDPRDTTVRLALGLPTGRLGDYARTRDAVPGNPFWREDALLWDLRRTRPLRPAVTGTARR